MILLGVISVCLIAITAMLALITQELRVSLRRLNAMLPQADRVFREAHRALHLIRQVLTTPNQAAHRVETVIHQACDAASEVLERFNGFRAHAGRLFTSRFGNGTRAGSRSQHRRGEATGGRG